MLHEQTNIDMKSLLSVIAHSAEVEVWLIEQESLALLPLDVQNKIINRLKNQQIVKIET